MKAVFITYDQAHNEAIVRILDKNSLRGFTYWEQVQGRGSFKGEPHYGSHAWPGMNSSMMVMTEDSKVEKLLSELKALDDSKQALGLRAFVMNVEQSI